MGLCGQAGRLAKQASQTGRQKNLKTNFMCIIMYVYMCMNDILFDVFIFRLKTNRQRWRIFLICCLNEGMCMHVCVYMYGQYTIELWLFKYWAMCSLALRCTERLFRQSCGYFLYFYDQGAFYLFLSSRFYYQGAFSCL